VIYLRFKSLSSDVFHWHSAAEVFRMTGVKQCSQFKIISRWRLRGFLILKPKREGTNEILSKEQIQWVIDYETLEGMSHLSLRKRAQIIRERFNLPKFQHSTLQRYYLRYGIKFKRPDYKFWRSNAENHNLKGEQFIYVQDLVSQMAKKTFDEIIYIDETTCNLWQKVSKCWLRPGMKLRMLKCRGHSITIICAISQERGLIHFEVFEVSNNADQFSHFLVNLKQKCEGKKVAIVQDNLKIHHANEVKKLYNQNFIRIMLPPYSCELNPIERLWAIVKRKWT
jgi:transposase